MLKKTGALNAINSLLNFDKLRSDGKVTLAKRKEVLLVGAYLLGKFSHCIPS